MDIFKSTTILLLLKLSTWCTCTTSVINKTLPTITVSTFTNNRRLQQENETTRFTKGNTNSNVVKAVQDDTQDNNGKKEKNKRTSQLDVFNYDELGKAINFARYELTNYSTLPYKEQIDEVINVTKERHGDGLLYQMKLRLSASDCQRDNASCDPYFDTTFMPSNEAQIIAPLDSPLKPGKAITVHGMIPMLSKGFHITILTGYEKPVSAQLRLKAKFQRDGTIIELQYFEEGQWNLYNHYKGFFEPKKTFQLLIMCLSSKFEIYIDDNILSSFPHILRYEDAEYLSIFGDVSVTNITGVGSYLPVQNVHPLKSWREDDIQYETSPYVPFVAQLARPLVPGRSIRVRGSIPRYSEKFAITIQTGSDLEPRTAQFRLLADFKDGKSHLSSMYFDGSWKDEEFADSTLKSGHSFDIMVTCQINSFKISINSKEIVEYRYEHRLPYTSATHLSVVGMVNVSEVVGISKLPYVKFLDKPKFFPFSVPFKNVTLSPGQKTRIWGYILDTAKVFFFDYKKPNDANESYFHIHIYTPEKGAAYFHFNDQRKGRWGNMINNTNLTWLKRGQPIQMEISCLEKSYKVTFYGLWTYKFDYPTALNKTPAVLQFYDSGLAVHGVDGVSAEPEPQPPPPPPSRLCRVNVWSWPAQREMWSRHLVCTTE